MAKRQPTRQKTRKALIIFSFLLFPITINYFSPYVIIDGASQGVVNGSFISFSLMFLSALFVGRLWCGWGCPAGGIRYLLHRRRPAGGPLAGGRPESGMPLYLLDGAVHDPGPQAAEPVPLALAAPEGEDGRLHRLQTVYGHLPDEPGREWDGAERGHGEQRVHPVWKLRRRVPAGCDPLLLQRREIER